MPQSLSEARRQAAPRLPEGVRVYAVGDLHGCADLLAGLLSQIDAHLSQHPIARPIEVFLGDYIDRGPDSRRVIDLLIKRGETRETIFLKGNHETYLLQFLKDQRILDIWLQRGGFETLLSYGVKPPLRKKPRKLAKSFAAMLPKGHLRFLSHLMTNFECGDFLFVHAGVQPGVPLDRQREEDLLWIRDGFLQSDDDFGKYIVHGHTPVQEPDIRPNRINIDTGAFATGRLTCVMIEAEEMQIISQMSNNARVSNDALVEDPIAQDDFLPVAEFFISNSPAIVPQKEAHDALGDGSNRPSGASLSEVEFHARPSTAQPQSRQLINQETGQDSSRDKGRGLPRFATLAVIALLALGAASAFLTSRLTPQSQINAAADDNRVSDAGSNETPATPTEQTSPDTQSELRLVLRNSLSGVDGDALPLGAQASGEALGLAVEIGGLPKGMTISAGRHLGTGEWRILAEDVTGAVITPPPGFVGAVDLSVELRLADDTPIDQGSLHREWRPSPANAAGPNEAASTVSAHSGDHETAPPAIVSDQGMSSLESSQLDHDQIDFLIGRSETLISEGDVEAARILLHRAAEAHSARAALTLGATYDPIMLAILHVNGVTADVSQARGWYEKANELGSQEAQQRLNLLATSAPQSATVEIVSPPSTPSASAPPGRQPPSERTVESAPPLPRPPSALLNLKPQPSAAEHAPKPTGTKCKGSEGQDACKH
jgi:serine/threonine protein phosphatase 1